MKRKCTKEEVLVITTRILERTPFTESAMLCALTTYDNLQHEVFTESEIAAMMESNNEPE